MAYIINRYNTSQLTVVEDGTIDQTTDLKLVGKNYAGYGEIQNENFVFLLENFAGSNQPPRAITGQTWYDSGNKKLKFYNGEKWKTTGGSEVSGTAPAGLSEGDFWWDRTNEQLYAFNGNDFILVGPQDAGDGITQMQSKTVRDTDGLSKNIIAAVVNDETIFVISPVEFTIDSSDAENAISGFDVIREGVTLKNTTSTTGGVTSDDHQFHGTASNALRLGGRLATEYVVSNPGQATEFENQTNFRTDAGIAIGNDLDLRLFIENDNQGVILNQQGNVIKIRAKQVGGNLKNVIDMNIGSITPGANQAGNGYEQIDIGQDGVEFQNIYANRFRGTANNSRFLLVDSDDQGAGGTEYAGSISTKGVGTPSTVALRDSEGNLRATEFQGTATSAFYADLAEKYTTAEEFTTGTIMAVCAHEDHEMDVANPADIVAGVISENPAFLMNSELEGQAIALKGRVPVRVFGPVTKGDQLFVDQDGIASTVGNGDLVGIALESNSTQAEKLVECFLKV